MTKLHEKEKTVSFSLHPHQLRKLGGLVSGTTVVCDKGIIWLTESNVNQDFALKAGRQVVIGKKSDVLIEAVNEADFHIIYPN
ncbi:MAG: DUF2917 domain-containing protein [Anaerolineales bacterium]